MKRIVVVRVAINLEQLLYRTPGQQGGLFLVDRNANDTSQEWRTPFTDGFASVTKHFGLELAYGIPAGMAVGGLVFKNNSLRDVRTARISSPLHRRRYGRRADGHAVRRYTASRRRSHPRQKGDRGPRNTATTG